MIFDLSKINSIANTFIAEIRDENIQIDSMRFRKNLERLGEFFAFEISKTLHYKEIETQTPLGKVYLMYLTDLIVHLLLLTEKLKRVEISSSRWNTFLHQI